MIIDIKPSRETLIEYIGDAISALDELIEYIDINYGFDSLWNYSEKHDKYEFKYRRGGKTLVTFYIEKGTLTILIVFGKAERANFEQLQNEFSSEIVQLYNNTPQYHDGKWLWISLSDKSIIEEVKKLILIKRKPKG
ncbi:MAG: DUF3788 domain-containing protein [Bacillota bacterium]|nr:DUF3788 domain-containing protein [Bacillota bacterium]